MKNLHYLLLLGIVLLFSCTKDDEAMMNNELLLLQNEVISDLNPMASLTKNMVKRPFKGKVIGTVKLDFQNSECGNGIPLFEVSAMGNATHLGKYTGEVASQCLLPQPLYGTWTTANGDEIYFDLLRDFTVEQPNVRNEIWLTGGTGRFQYVEGYVEEIGTTDFDFATLEGTFEFKTEGWIKY